MYPECEMFPNAIVIFVQCFQILKHLVHVHCIFTRTKYFEYASIVVILYKENAIVIRTVAALENKK